MVSPASHQVLRAWWYSGTREQVSSISITGLSPSSVGLSRLVLLCASFVTTCSLCRTALGPSTPCTQRRQPITCTKFGLFPVRSPLLRELSLFFGVLRCFSSPTCLPCFAQGSLSITREGLPHSDIHGSACKQLPVTFRSVATSFFGPGCLGILHTLFLACPNLYLAPLL